MSTYFLLVRTCLSKAGFYIRVFEKFANSGSNLERVFLFLCVPKSRGMGEELSQSWVEARAFDRGLSDAAYGATGHGVPQW